MEEALQSFLTVDRIPEFIGFVVGILYLYWEYHADPRMWFANIVMPIISFWVYYRAGLYADFAMNCYYFIMAIYGYIAWTRGIRRGDSARRISHISLGTAVATVVVFFGVYALIAMWLIICTDSSVPYLDAFTTAMSIIATWMLARKYIEQWLAWIAVDAVCVYLYFFKDRQFYAVLYGIYTVIAVLGYMKWRKLMKKEHENAIRAS